MEGVREEQLTAPTPCPDCAVRNMLGHLLGLSVAFRDAARKDLGATTDTAPDAAAPDIGPGWREELPEGSRRTGRRLARPRRLDRDDPRGRIDLPGAVAGAVAADELVIHGWDLARATGQPYDPDPAALQVSHDFLLAAADDPSRGGGIFGPVVPVPADAPLLDRAVGLSGRDPGWRTGAQGA